MSEEFDSAARNAPPRGADGGWHGKVSSAAPPAQPLGAAGPEAGAPPLPLEATLSMLIETGSAMVAAQKRYFGERTRDNLIASKVAEGAFGKALMAAKRRHPPCLGPGRPAQAVCLWSLGDFAQAQDEAAVARAFRAHVAALAAVAPPGFALTLTEAGK